MFSFYVKNWCFTFNNFVDEESFNLAVFGEFIAADGDESLFSYFVFGRETGEGGIPHLQGYFCLRSKQRLITIKQIPGLSRAYLEV